MKNKSLDQIWAEQSTNIPNVAWSEISKKANAQRRKQNIGIGVMSLTLAVIIGYSIWQFPKEFNMFIVGLLIMILALVLRIGLEFYFKLQKGSQMIRLNAKEYLSYLKSYYGSRKLIHYVVTPICFGGYVCGLLLLFPYFKEAFSEGFYLYLVISGIVSLLVIAVIIVNQVIKELQFIKQLLS